VQIGDENVHRVRAVLDEVFGENNFVAQITVRVKSPLSVSDLARTTDFLIWYPRAVTHLARQFLPTGSSYQPKWREGECVGTWDALRMRAQETRNRASQARYWWKGFLTAPDALSAFCAWQIFLACADKMAWVWMDSDIESHREGNELWRLKMLHMRFNESALESAINEKSNKGANSLDRHLVGMESPDSWFTPDALTGLGY
jgi:hypothetical protein